MDPRKVHNFRTPQVIKRLSLLLLSAQALNPKPEALSPGTHAKLVQGGPTQPGAQGKRHGGWNSEDSELQLRFVKNFCMGHEESSMATKCFE